MASNLQNFCSIKLLANINKQILENYFFGFFLADCLASASSTAKLLLIPV